MKGRRLGIVPSVLAIVAIVLAGCQAQTATAPAPATAAPAAAAPATAAPAAAAPAAAGGKSYHFCVVHNLADHPSITAIAKGMKDEAAHYNVTLTFFDPAMDPQKQVSMIEDCIALKPDLILVNAVDPAAVVPALKKVHDAGIPLIMHNADTNADGQQYSLSFVGPDFVEQGRQEGRLILAAVPQGAKGVIIEGKPGQTSSVDAINGAKEVLNASGKNIQILAEEPADWQPAKATTVMQDLLTRFPSPQINFVFALDDPMALGAVEAMRAAGRLQEIKVFGLNGNKGACDAIKTGVMAGTVLQMSYLMGTYSIRAGYDVMQGIPIATRISPPTIPISPQNVDQLYNLCW